MFKKLTLKNFQSHKNSNIEFSDKLNIFVGITDSGKSAILRGLKWVIKNKPNVNFESRIRKGTSSCEVELDVDGNKVKRARNKTSNTYTLNGSVLKAFGMNTPEEVDDVFNVNPVSWQEQHDSVFLLSNTGREVSKYLNSIIGLSDIDTAIKNINKKYLNVNQEIKLRESDSVSVSEELKKYDWLDTYSTSISDLDKIIEEYNTNTNIIDTYKNMLLEYNSMPTIVTEHVISFYSMWEQHININNAIEVIKSITNVTLGIVNTVGIEQDIYKWESTSSKINAVTSILDAQYVCRNVDTYDITSTINDFNGLCTDITIIKQLYSDLVQTEKAINKEELELLEEEFRLNTQECPLCGK